MFWILIEFWIKTRFQFNFLEMHFVYYSCYSFILLSKHCFQCWKANRVWWKTSKNTFLYYYEFESSTKSKANLKSESAIQLVDKDITCYDCSCCTPTTKNLFIIFTTFKRNYSVYALQKIYFKISLKGQSLATHVSKAGHISMQSLTYNLCNQSARVSFEEMFHSKLKALSQHSIIGKKTNDNISKDKSKKRKEFFSYIFKVLHTHQYFSRFFECYARCLKIKEKVSSNIANKASYVYILSGQKLIKNAKNAQFGEFLKTWSLGSNSDTRQVNFSRKKLVENTKIQKCKWDILVIFKQCGYEKKLACEVTHSSSTKIGDWSLYKLPKIFPKDKSWVSSNPTFLYEAQALLCSLYSNAFVDKLPCLLHSDYPFSFRTISYLTLAILASTWFDLLL